MQFHCRLTNKRPRYAMHVYQIEFNIIHVFQFLVLPRHHYKINKSKTKARQTKTLKEYTYTKLPVTNTLCKHKYEYQHQSIKP